MTAPIYNPNVPENVTDSYAVTQPSLQANFQSLYDIFKINHIPLDSLTEIGNHTHSDLFQQNGPIQTGVSELALYTKKVDEQTTQLFMRQQGNGTEIQLTNYQIYSINNVSFFTFLPGGIIVYFGQAGAFVDPLNPNIVVQALNPQISKNIMSVSLCPVSQTSLPHNYKPWVSFTRDEKKGVVTAINFNYAIRASNTYYLILGNT